MSDELVKQTEQKLFAGKPGPGRPKGSANKSTVLMKQAMMAVYEDLQERSGKDHGHFIQWAENNPTEFYKLASKLLPIQVEGEMNHRGKVALTWLKS